MDGRCPAESTRVLRCWRTTQSAGWIGNPQHDLEWYPLCQGRRRRPWGPSRKRFQAKSKIDGGKRSTESRRQALTSSVWFRTGSQAASSLSLEFRETGQLLNPEAKFRKLQTFSWFQIVQEGKAISRNFTCSGNSLSQLSSIETERYQEEMGATGIAGRCALLHLKTIPPNDLAETIREVRAGKKPIPPRSGGANRWTSQR